MDGVAESQSASCESESIDFLKATCKRFKEITG